MQYPSPLAPGTPNVKHVGLGPPSPLARRLVELTPAATLVPMAAQHAGFCSQLTHSKREFKLLSRCFFCPSIRFFFRNFFFFKF